MEDTRPYERVYREKLMGELWRYGQVVGALGVLTEFKGCIWNNLGAVQAINDLNHLAGTLPYPTDEGQESVILEALDACHAPLVRNFPPEDVLSLMKLAAGIPSAVNLYGKVPVQLFDPPKVVNLRQRRLRSTSFDVIRNYMARHWPRDVTHQDMADKMDRPVQFVKRNNEPYEVRIVDFMNIMQALGRNPTFALKELAAELEEALAEAERG